MIYHVYPREVLLALVVTGVIVLVCRLARHAEKTEQAEAVAKAASVPPVVPACEVFGPLTSGRIPPRPAPRVPAPPLTDDESELRANGDLLFAEAIRACRHDAEVRANAALMDAYATQYPMQQRARLVDRAASESNPLSAGEVS